MHIIKQKILGFPPCLTHGPPA